MKNVIFSIFLLMVSALFSCSKDELAAVDGQGISGSITRFQVYQGYLYGLNNHEVQTYDLSDADHPKLVHSLQTDYGLETITIYDGTIYIGSTDALYILNIDEPAMPVLLSKTTREGNFSGCDPVVVKDNYAYSTIKIVENICGMVSEESALVVFDVTNQSFPQEVGRFLLDIPNGLGILGDYLLICDEGSDRLEIFDISDPTNVLLTDFGFALTDPVDLIVQNELLIVSTKTSFEVFDASEIFNIRKLARITK